MVNSLHGNYETSIFEICFHGFPKLFEENSQVGSSLCQHRPFHQGRENLVTLFFGCHSGCFRLGPRP